MLNTKIKSLINNLLVAGLVFTIPSNLFLILSRAEAFVHGLQIDYLLPKFYLSELIILTLTVWLILTRQLKLPPIKFGPNHWLVVSLTFIFLSIQIASSSPLFTIWQLVKLLEIPWLIWLLSELWPKLKLTAIWLSINLCLIFQSSLALLQFFNQSSIAGYWLLGEPNLNRQLGLAKQVLFGQNLILPYGTTAHPNVLGGIIVGFLICSWLLKLQLKPSKQLTTLWLLTNGLGLAALGATQSWSAVLALITAIGVIKLRPKFKTLLMTNLLVWLVALAVVGWWGSNSAQPSWFRRAYLNQAAWKMIVSRPLTGVGLNRFTAEVENFSPNREVVRFTQPAHHTPLLIVSEIGFIGLITLVIWLKKLDHAWRKTLLWVLSSLLPIIVLDHYLYTLQSGALLFSLLMIVFKNSSNPLRK